MAHALLAPDGFASGHLGLSVFRLTDVAAAREALAGITTEPGAVLVEVKVPVERVADVAALTALGFWVVDTAVQLDAPAPTLIAAAVPVGADSRVRDAEPTDREVVARIVGENMINSRYHLDPRIDPTRASAFKRAWVSNFFDGLRGQRLLVTVGARGVGAILLVLEKGNQGVIDLIAVDQAHRGSHSAARLIQMWLTSSPHLASVLVGTQVSNLPSLRLYGRLGFRVCGASHVLHYLRRPGGAQA